MNSVSSSVLVSDTIGKVSILTIQPKKLTAMIVLAHGAGAGMTHHFMEALAEKLAALSVGTVRYNFPYVEKGSKRPDVPAVAEKTVQSVLEHVQRQYPGTPIFLGGKSFGGRMSSQFAAKKNPEGVKGLVFYGFPLHAPGKPDIQRAEHLKLIRIPLLFLQGTNDTLASLSLIEAVCAGIPAATLVKFQGADHSFKVKKVEIISDLASATLEWVTKHLS